MECLLTFCFVTQIYVTGSVGMQAMPSVWGVEEEMVTNDYDLFIGEARVVMEFLNGSFVEVKHISGLNTPEADGGINAVMVGAKIRFY